MSQEPQSEPKPCRIAFVDLETTGLDPHRHEPWEIAIDVVDVLPDGTRREHIRGADKVYYPRLRRMGNADPIALKISGYYDSGRLRTPRGQFPQDHEKVAEALATLIPPGTILAGCTIHFDAAFLDVFMRESGQCPMWDYHLLDVTTYAAGLAQLRPPWKSTTLFERYGIATNDAMAHTALYDAQQAQRLFWAAHDSQVQP